MSNIVFSFEHIGHEHGMTYSAGVCFLDFDKHKGKNGFYPYMYTMYTRKKSIVRNGIQLFTPVRRTSYAAK